MKLNLHTSSPILISFLILLTSLASCQSDTDRHVTASEAKAQEIIDASIKTHGGEQFDNMMLSFDFRERHYTASRKKGNFEYTREFEDSLGQVKDVLNNKGFYREINGKKVDLPDERKDAFSNSVNSVIYFALLPFGLNDAAVNKEYAGESTIKGIPYHKIKVTFAKEGGGSDHEDEYIYWINQTSHTMDYLAYSFQVDGGGLRFREAYNVRKVNGVLFADYHNYAPITDTLKLDEMDVAFEASALKMISDIDLKNIVNEKK